MSNEISKPADGSDKPRILIVAGPNGAGKTTFAREFLVGEAHCPAFVNADLIAAGLSPFAPDLAARKAARIMLETIVEHVGNRESFAFETTLSGRAYARHIPEWRALGYHVKLFFLRLPSAELAIERVAQRVRQGGHDIPADTIRRRFAAGLANFDSCTSLWWIAGCCWIIQPAPLRIWIGVNDEYKTD